MKLAEDKTEIKPEKSDNGHVFIFNFDGEIHEISAVIQTDPENAIAQVESRNTESDR